MSRFTFRSAALIASVTALALGCEEQITQPDVAAVSPQFARGDKGGGKPDRGDDGETVSPSTVVTFRDGASDNIRSDGLVSYEDGNCGVLADFSLTDARLDPDAGFKGKVAKTCGTSRFLLFEWDQPADGGNSKPTREDGIFMNIDGVETETGTNVRHMGQFNVCNRLVFNSEFHGSDDLLVSRVVSGADTSWTVRTQPYPNDKGYCVGDGRLWHMPFELTIRRK